MKYLLGLSLLFCISLVYCQDQYYPVKIDKKWGLIDAQGDLFIDPVYDAVGHFSNGYAVIQTAGKIGLLDQFGKEVFAPKFQDIRVLDTVLFSVFENNNWRVINKQGTTILNQTYDQITLLNPQFIGFSQNGKWGIAHISGKLLADAIYEKVEAFENQFVIAGKPDNYDLITADGTVILNTTSKKLAVSDDLIFYKDTDKWGTISFEGTELLPAIHDNWTRISSNFYKFKIGNEALLFSNVTKKIISENDFFDFRFFSSNYVYTQANFKVGLMNAQGEQMVPTVFEEIQNYDNNQLFRVSQEGKWGIFEIGAKLRIDIKYDFIGPPTNSIAIVMSENKFGVINLNGELQTDIEYDRITLEQNEAKAYKNGTLNLITFTEDGQLQEDDHFENFGTIKVKNKARGRLWSSSSTSGNIDNPYLLKNFEWYYHTQTRKWGLRDRNTGKIVIPPTYFEIEVHKDLGFTIVSMEAIGNQTFERTRFNYYLTFGIINNEFGRPSTLYNLINVEVDDVDIDSMPIARCVFSNGKHGLISRRGGIINDNYAFIGKFENGLARVSIKGEMTAELPKNEYHLGKLDDYLDNLKTQHKLINNTKHDLQLEKEGVVQIKDGIWGFIDTLGKVAIQPQFEFVSDFNNGISIVKLNGKWGSINTKGELLIEPNFDRIHFIQNSRDSILRIYKNCEKYGVVDSTGRLAVEVKYDKIGQISEDRVPVKLGSKWGFVDKNGTPITPTKYEKVQPFSEGLAAVRYKRKWGYINRKGNLIIDHQFRRAGNFSDGKSWAAISSFLGYIDQKGAMIIEPQYHKCEDFNNGLAIVRIGSEHGVINESGKFVVKPKFKKIEPFGENGLAVVHYNALQSYGLINQKGERVGNEKFEKIMPFSEGRAAIRMNGKFGFIDVNGQIVIPPSYNRVEAFKEGRARFIKEGRWGFIDVKGKEVIPPMYSKCQDFKDGKAVVYKGFRSSGLITKDGSYLIEPHLGSLISFDEGRGLIRTRSHSHYYITDDEKLYKGYYQNAAPFKYGVASVKYNDRWGLINRKGIELIAPKYHKFSTFEGGYASVRINNFSGIAGLNGQILIKPEYEYITYAGGGLFRVEHGDKIGYFDTNGEWVWQLRE